jgi:hypothetical protein
MEYRHENLKSERQDSAEIRLIEKVLTELETYQVKFSELIGCQMRSGGTEQADSTFIWEWNTICHY